MIDTSVLALLVVGIIGYCILSKSDNGSNMLKWSDVGKILLIFAIVEGLMYLVAPIPARLVSDKPNKTIDCMIMGGGDEEDIEGGEYLAGGGVVLESIE